MGKNVLIAVVLSSFCGCTTLRPPTLPPSTSGHINAAETSAAPSIPAVVERTPFIPPPEPVPERERYTVVVNNVPVRELLFALARDASVNIDIHANIEGPVTLNAIDQTLTQILERVRNQIDMRYEIRGDTVLNPR